MKLVEEIGEVAEVLNGRSGRKKGVQDSNEELAKELADIIHYTVAIAAINDIDLTKTIFEKDKKAAIKYQHERDLEGFLENFKENKKWFFSYKEDFTYIGLASNIENNEIGSLYYQSKESPRGR